MEIHVSLCMPRPHKPYSRRLKPEKFFPLQPLYLAYALRRDNYTHTYIIIYFDSPAGRAGANVQ